MAHTVQEKQKLLNRIRRIRGQMEGVEKIIAEDGDCFATLQTVAACRGALNGLMAEIMEGHVRSHIIDTARKPSREQLKAAEDLIDVVNTYLK
jgi:DNA-binding FrmR family transcriptional regulator